MLKIKLAKREKYVVVAAACFIALFLLINFAVLPFFKEKGRLSKGILVKEAEFKEIAALSSEYLKYREEAGEMERILAKRGKGFTLMSYLDNAAGEAGVKGQIKYMNPSKSSSTKGVGAFEESGVEIKVEAINTDQLVSYLYLVEDPEDLIFIKRISVTDNKKQDGYLDSIIQVMTYE
jgi:general secretion pathway protein M